MEIKIGVQYSSRDVTIDVDKSPEEVTALVEESLRQGSPLRLSDARGRQVLVQGSAITFVEIGSSTTGTVGFRS